MNVVRGLGKVNTFPPAAQFLEWPEGPVQGFALLPLAGWLAIGLGSAQLAGWLAVSLGLAQMIVAQGVWNLREWARIGAIILSVALLLCILPTLGLYAPINQQEFFFLAFFACVLPVVIIVYLTKHKVARHNFRFRDKDGQPLQMCDREAENLQQGTT
jgi:hypothetical protein